MKLEIDTKMELDTKYTDLSAKQVRTGCCVLQYHLVEDKGLKELGEASRISAQNLKAIKDECLSVVEQYICDLRRYAEGLEQEASRLEDEKLCLEERVEELERRI